MSPVGKPEAYYAAFGWAPAVGIKPDQVPDPNTIWTVVGNNILTPSSSISLVWNNGNGVTFMRKISIDEKYMFTVEQGIQNNSGSEISLRPYGLLRRHGEPKDMKNFFILHEGIIRMSDSELAEEDYDDIQEEKFSRTSLHLWHIILSLKFVYELVYFQHLSHFSPETFVT